MLFSWMLFIRTLLIFRLIGSCFFDFANVVLDSFCSYVNNSHSIMILFLVFTQIFITVHMINLHHLLCTDQLFSLDWSHFFYFLILYINFHSKLIPFTKFYGKTWQKNPYDWSFKNEFLWLNWVVLIFWAGHTRA